MFSMLHAGYLGGFGATLHHQEGGNTIDQDLAQVLPSIRNHHRPEVRFTILLNQWIHTTYKAKTKEDEGSFSLLFFLDATWTSLYNFKSASHVHERGPSFLQAH